MSPQSPAAAPTAATAESAADHYDAERLAVIKLMLLMTGLAVVLVAVVTSWFGVLNIMDNGLNSSILSSDGAKLVGGAAVILVLMAGMAYTWLRLVKRLLRMDWVG